MIVGSFLASLLLFPSFPVGIKYALVQKFLWTFLSLPKRTRNECGNLSSAFCLSETVIVAVHGSFIGSGNGCSCSFIWYFLAISCIWSALPAVSVAYQAVLIPREPLETDFRLDLRTTYRIGTFCSSQAVTLVYMISKLCLI